MHLRNLSVCVVLGLAAACSSGSSGSGGGSPQASTQDPDAAVAWFDLLYDTIRDEGLSPPVASRVIGYCGVAAYESVVPGMADFQSLKGQLNDLDSVPDIGPGVHHWPAVLSAALADLLPALLDNPQNATLMAIDALEQQLTADFQMDVAQDVLDRSVTRGEEIAAAILAWAMDDGYAMYQGCAYTAPTGPGLWEPTPPGFANALEPCWGRLRPFVLLFGAECSVLPPPAFSTTPGSPFYNECEEVYETVNNLTQGELDIAQFWADNPGQTGTPPGHWISIVGQVLEQQGMSLEDAVHAYGRVGLAVADAFISCWDMKFFYNLVRPITVIQDPAGFNDPAWTTAPGVGTPPFPEYTSGHSVQSGAAAHVLDDLWGDLPFDDDTHAGLWPMRSFDGFFEAAEEAAISRLYGGIHYRAAIERGVEQGRCIGATILDEVSFRK